MPKKAESIAVFFGHMEERNSEESDIIGVGIWRSSSLLSLKQ